MIRKAAPARMQRSVWPGHSARRLPLGMVVAAFLTPAPSLAGETPGDVALTLNVMIPMRDGVQLAADVYRPALDGVPLVGRFPALLMRTPYDKEVRAAAFAQYFVSRGYVVVVQDVRARYRSQGHWRPLSDDGRDGYDTTQWIGHQSWSDGGIGTVGTSYEGGTQHALAIADAPFVKAMIPLFSMSDVGRYGVRHNGAFELRWVNWVFSMGDPGGPPNLVAAARAASDPAAAPALADLVNHVPEYLRALPLRAGDTPLKFAPDYEEWLTAAMSHGGDDPVEVVDHLADYKDIPVYHVTGWYDSWALQVANLNYVGLHERKKSPQRLIVGPWTHSRPNASYAGDAQFTPEAAIDLNAFEQRWFDRWLKGIDNGVDLEAPVRIYVMGGGDGHKTPEGRVFVGGRWRDEQEWPLARATPTAYYLHADGVLSPDQPVPHAPLTYRFDPHNPVPTLGGNISSQGALASAGATDQRCRPTLWTCSDSNPLSARNDVLVFQTPPLARDLEVTGRLIVRLWAASDSPDTDFTAKLIDVYPPSADFPGGIELNIGDSIVRARYRNGPGRAEMLQPGKPYEFTIEMYPTSLVFRHGHRIRLDISSSNFPRFDVNPNTGEPLNDNRRWRIAENSVYFDPAHPSRIVLPLVPTGSP
ncbi:MAG: CocE/NonD family hydrolase [Gammaproteobacteria bacterium]|nr:MAG: CocE/NonD family hydrolase [Gammaproteobacteria bacterium]